MEPEEELQSFPYDAVIGGRKHHYRITENEHRFGIDGGSCGHPVFDHDRQCTRRYVRGVELHD